MVNYKQTHYYLICAAGNQQNLKKRSPTYPVLLGYLYIHLTLGYAEI